MSLPIGLVPFANQSRTAHAGVLVGGALALWTSLLDESAIEAWQRAHLSAEFRQEFIEE